METIFATDMPEVKQDAALASDGIQYASGGHPEMAMAPSPTEPTGSVSDTKSMDTQLDDFLMIQLSCFEGRAEH